MYYNNTDFDALLLGNPTGHEDGYVLRVLCSALFTVTLIAIAFN